MVAAQRTHSGRHVALIVSYHGGAYHGFQDQTGQNTVQGRLQDALSDLAGVPVTVRGAGRTDAGVHAAGQVVDCWLPESLTLPVARVPLALAARLPADVTVASAWSVSPRFHARFTAETKCYRYLIWRQATVSPFARPFAWHYHGALDVAAMAAAAPHLEGRHDLRVFAGAARPVNDATRTVVGCYVGSAGPWLVIRLEADGFLYRMVRSMAGTLWRVGTGALRPDALPEMIRRGQRAEAGPSLPPQGLCLLWVRYPEGQGLPPPSHGAWPPPPGPSDPWTGSDGWVPGGHGEPEPSSARR